MNQPETADKVPICDVRSQLANIAYTPASIQYVYPADQEVCGDICEDDNAMMYGSRVVMQPESTNSKKVKLPSELLALLTPINK